MACAGSLGKFGGKRDDNKRSETLVDRLPSGSFDFELVLVLPIAGAEGTDGGNELPVAVDVLVLVLPHSPCLVVGEDVDAEGDGRMMGTADEGRVERI